MLSKVNKHPIMKINQRVFVLREAITKIVPMLSQKTVTVTLRGMKAFVEYDPVTNKPRRVNLPYLPDDAKDDLIDAVQGFLDHEVAHILFSDATLFDDPRMANDEVKFLTNALEDTRIERLMQERFTGTAFNLANTSRFFLKEMVEPRVKAAIADDNEEGVLGNLMVPAIRSWAGQGDFTRFMAEEDRWNRIKDFTSAVGQDLIDRIPQCETNKDCLDLAVEIQKRTTNGKPPEEPPPPPSGGSGSGAPGTGKAPTPTAGEEEGEDESAAGEEEEEGEEEGDAPPPLSQAEMNSPGIPEKMAAAVNQAIDFDEGVAEALSARAEQDGANSDYLVFTRDDDVVEPIVASAAAVAALPAMQAQVEDMLGPLQAEIERMVAAKSMAVWTGGHKRGRLHSAALTRAKFGAVDLFRRKQVNITKDTAVELVVDCSGSMCSGNKIQTACYSAFALASVLERLNIPVEVTGFTTRPFSASVRADLMRQSDPSAFARFEALNIVIFKAFDERLTTDVKARFAQVPMAHGLCSSNVDGESILISARRLALRREARKIMIVLSDGNPACHGHGNLDQHLKDAVKMIIASNIDLFGIGIMDHSVEKYYPKRVVMNTVRELPEVVMGHLKQALLK